MSPTLYRLSYHGYLTYGRTSLLMTGLLMIEATWTELNENSNDEGIVFELQTLITRGEIQRLTIGAATDFAIHI